MRRLSTKQFHPRLEELEERRLLSITEFATPTPYSSPEVIASGPDGNLWFTEQTANKIAQATPDGSITEFPIQTPNAGLSGITAGPDGNLWFTENRANQIGRISPNGTNVTEYRIPTANSGPSQILTGPDGNLWFLESNYDQLARLDPSTGRVTEFALPTGRPEAMTVGPDGNLWYTDSAFDRLGRVTLNGQVSEFPVPTPGAGLEGITAGPDGGIWFAESSASKIGRLNPSNGSVQEFPTYSHRSYPWAITAGMDGNLWFTESDLSINQIGRITPDGQVDEFAIPSPNSAPLSIVSGPDCNIWFTENFKGKIGRYYLDLPATHFLVSTAGSSTAGVSVDVTVTALDKCDRTVFDYTGSVSFTCSDAQATLPINYTFTSNDDGVHTFSGGATLFTAGDQTIALTDAGSGINGGCGIAVSAAAANHFLLSTPDAVAPGHAFDITLTALDPYGNVAASYEGSVAFSTSDTDPEVTLPAEYTFTDNDQGSHTFDGEAKLFSVGDQTLTAIDTITGINGAATLTVVAPPAPRSNFPSVSGTNALILSSRTIEAAPSSGVLESAKPATEPGSQATPGHVAAAVMTGQDFQQALTPGLGDWEELARAVLA
jgi:streptogramin lyase